MASKSVLMTDNAESGIGDTRKFLRMETSSAGADDAEAGTKPDRGLTRKQPSSPMA
jgi:hypothetical protein